MGIFDFLKKNKNIENDNGLNETYYDNGRGELKETFTKKNGKREGLYKQFFRNCQLNTEGSYTNDQRVGMFRTYYSTGEVRSEGNYSENKKNGNWTFYKYRKSHRENGDRNNISKYYIEKVNGKYENGEKEGVWKRTKEGCVDGKKEGEWEKNQNEITDYDIIFENYQKKQITIYSNEGDPEIKYTFYNKKKYFLSNNEKWIEDTDKGGTYIEGEPPFSGHYIPYIDFEDNYEYHITFFDDLEKYFFGENEDISIELQRKVSSSLSDDFDGVFRLYHLNGQLKSEKKWKGKELIYSKCWDENGKRVSCE